MDQTVLFKKKYGSFLGTKELIRVGNNSKFQFIYLTCTFYLSSLNDLYLTKWYFLQFKVSSKNVTLLSN